MLSKTGWGATAGAIVTGAVGGVTGVAVKVKSGCVLDIFPGAGFGGSGRILMRAVSLTNGVVGGAAGGAGAAAAVPMGRGTGVLAAGSGGGGTAAGGGGGGANVRGTGTLAAGGLGNGTCDTGGRGIGTLPGFGTSGVDVGGGSDVGGRAGRLIRTVSSSCGATASPRRGGRVIRTVSFFGWLASAMVTLTGGKIRLPKIGYVVTGKLRSLGKRWRLHEALPTFVSFVFFVRDHLLE